ncbi:MAG TPA: hypothetical protein VKU82_11290 [Planctomycetaceae bacterium]|nr:hypothetical protein [Planctomycetaceae bacterium]
MITAWLSWALRRKRIRLQRPRKIVFRPMTAWAAECLEVRALLSNVAVTTAVGVIKLAGDTGDHTFDASVASGNLHLVGSAGTEFTFNGTTAATVDVPLSGIGTIKGLQIVMQAGNDTITFDAANLGTISGNVEVDLGGGTNSLSFKDATVTGKTVVKGGSGADSIQLSNDTLGALSIMTGDANDSVKLSTVTIDGHQVSSDSDDDDDGGIGGFLDTLLDGLFDGWFGGCWGGWGGRGDDFGVSRGSLNIQAGNGNDTIELDSVTGASSGSGGLSWLFSGDSWLFGSQWKISLGSGADTVTFNSVQAPHSLSVQGGSGNDTVNVKQSTVEGSTKVNLGSGQDQVAVSGSTFEGPARISTGPGDSQTVSINDSTFESFTKISVPGSNAKLNVQTAGTTTQGTVFDDPVVVSLPGPSAVANLGTDTGPDNTLDFESFLTVFGGNPAAAVNIATAGTAIDNNKLFLISANRNNV